MQATTEGHIDVDTLVVGAQKGDARSFASLYEHFFDQIFRYVSFKVGNSTEAEDITGEVFVRMLERITSYKPQGYPFSSWLFRVAHNLVVDYFRKNGKRKFTNLETVETTLGQAPLDIEGHVDQQMAMVQVYKAMDDLTDLQREVISLRFAGGLSIAEAAKAVGKKENAVKALQHAGVKKLRKTLVAQTENNECSVFPVIYQE